MALDFTAIDFEPANGFRGSACSVGVTRVRDGGIVDEAYWLMRPPEGFDHFDPRNVQIHGITADMVATAPRFGEVFGELASFIGADTVVAHNAAFDLGVIRSALEVSELAGPAYDFACTVKLARKTYSLQSYSLPFVAEAAGSPMENHHDALADARACASIMIDIGHRHAVDSGSRAAGAARGAMGHAAAYAPGDGLSKATVSARERLAAGMLVPAQPTWAGGWPSEGENPPPNPGADPAHPLYGETVVFSGNLSITRQEAKNRAAENGATCASRVTRATTVLVVGDGFVPGDLHTTRLTTKVKHVLRLREAGRGISLLSEGEFLQLVDGFRLA
ncbi:MAG: 3'-5' exoribonuclease [Micrococcaceae bacterium]|nr:3'-5' exoribonuclease [Micrococcaceae bacterium]